MFHSQSYSFSVIDASTPRLDGFLAKIFTNYSRSVIASWITAKCVTVNNQVIIKPRHTLRIQDHITVCIPDRIDQSNWQAQDIPLDIVHLDDSIIVINKPVNLTVHPGAGQQDGTLANALLHHFPEQKSLPRAGIVHRLDKDTSGLMVVARTETAHFSLVKQLQARSVKRIYHAIVHGNIIAGATIEQPIGRAPNKRTAMAVVSNGKYACSRYRVLEKFTHYTLIEVALETGRTHQIRVHMTHIKHPLIGDKLYGKQGFKKSSATLNQALHALNRQALHATTLSFTHPVTDDMVCYHAAYPCDFASVLEALRQESHHG